MKKISQNEVLSSWMDSCQIGGSNGYYALKWPWHLRGLLDQHVFIFKKVAEAIAGDPRF